MFGKISQQWVLPIALKLNSRDGNFAGVLVANLKTSRFNEVFASVKAGQRGAVIVFDAGTNILLRHPEPKGPGSAIGLKIGSPEFKALWNAGQRSATYRAQSTTDGIWRTYSFRQIGNYPLFIMVGIAEDEIFEPWWTQLGFTLAFLVGVCVSVVLLIAYVFSIRKREAQFQEILNASPIPMAVNQTSGEISYINPAFQQTLGYSLEDIPHLTDWFTLAYPDSLYRQQVEDEWIQRVHQYEEFGGHFHPLEVAVTAKNGTRHTMAVASNKLTTSSSYIITLFDLTQLKAAENSYRQAMIEREQLLQLIPVGVYRCRRRADGNDYFEFVSDLWCQQLGITKEAVLSDASEALSTILVEDRPDLLQTLEEATTAKQAFAWSGRISIQGKIRWIEIVSVYEADGQDVVWTGIQSDITERKRLQEELVQARILAEQANLAKSQFLATMSHEIRTPMNGVLGMAQLLMLPGIDEVTRLDYAGTILQSGKTLLTLLNDILDLSKIEAGRIELESKPFTPPDILHEISSLFAEVGREKGLTVSAVWHGESQRYAGDAYRLRQMLSNYVGNAIKFTANGSITIEAKELRRKEQQCLLEFRVTDTGIGVREDRLPFLFSPFTQADSSTTRMFGGTGLGLSIVRSLAKLMGGNVGVESIPNQGASFWFTVEVAQLQESAPPLMTHEAPIQTEPTETLASQGCVLVVEDNPTNRKVVCRLLERLGVATLVAENGQEALDAIQHGIRPNLILMDIQMPVMDGLTACKLIQQWETTKQVSPIPIIALTAGAFEEDRQAAMNAGMCDFLAKPVALDELTVLIEKWLKTPAWPQQAPQQPYTARISDESV